MSLTSKSTVSFKLQEKQRLIINLGTFVISIIGVLLISQLQTKEAELTGILVGVTTTAVTVLHLTQMSLTGKPHLSNAVIWIHFVLQKALTLILHIWVTLELVEEGARQGGSQVRSLHHLTAIALNIRAYAVGVTQGTGSSIDMVISGLLRMGTSSTAFPHAHEFTTLLFIVSLARRAGVRFCHHLISVIRITFAAFVSPLLDNKTKIGGKYLCIFPRI